MRLRRLSPCLRSRHRFRTTRTVRWKAFSNGSSVADLIDPQPFDNHDEYSDAEIKIACRLRGECRRAEACPRLRKVTTSERSRSMMKSAIRL